MHRKARPADLPPLCGKEVFLRSVFRARAKEACRARAEALMGFSSLVSFRVCYLYLYAIIRTRKALEASLELFDFAIPFSEIDSTSALYKQLRKARTRIRIAPFKKMFSQAAFPVD
jgi:predicted nucleic acid-binding protein